MTAKSQGNIIREQEYGRYGNPTQQEAERKLAAIEGAERAILFSTGMSAVILTLLAYLKPDGHIIFTNDCYRQTRDFAKNFLAKFGIAKHARGTVRRRHRKSHPAQHQHHFQRVAHQSILARARSSGRGQSGPAPWHPDDGGRHARHALQPAPAGTGRGPRHPFRHEISGRPQRPAGGRDARAATNCWRNSTSCNG